MIGATHKFHNQAYAHTWADRFKATPARRQLFADIGDLIESHVPLTATVLELGIGPGFLAAYLLDRFPHIHYLGLDFSQAMLAIAQDRLSRFGPRYQLLQFDLTQNKLQDAFPEPVDAVVSTWALHDLGSKPQIYEVYWQCRSVLTGILVNGDFIKPKGTSYEYEPGRIEIDEHLQMLQELGYSRVSCAGMYEVNVAEPTPANNYACLVGHNSMV